MIDAASMAAEAATSAEIQYAIARILRVTRKAIRLSGLTRRQYELLLILKAGPTAAQPSIGEIAARLGIRPHSAVGLADRLEQRGLARRRRVQRRVILETTAKGNHAVQAVATEERESLRTIAPVLLVGVTRALRQIGLDPSRPALAARERTVARGSTGHLVPAA